jgi:transcriptional regulator with GAF, ATPase, and Fis domain
VDIDFQQHVTEAVREMARQDGLTGTVDRAVQMCVDSIRHCDMAGASLIEGTTIRTLAASSESLVEVDELQYRLKEGPCYDAVQHDEVVTAGDLATDARWPRWGSQLTARTGLHASMSFRLFTTARVFGVLNLYSAQPYGFDADDVLDGHVVAAMVAAAVAASLKESQLTQALESRTVIGQATGILMERFGLDAETAFSVIRRVSQTHNVKISALAAGLVQGDPLPGSRSAVQESDPTDEEADPAESAG